ncbi:OPT family small oligopeptide transporter [Verruconis gallopava]|uniref:OPT family small oligopeptide transporter n=1 Tax=Verruconis gallopava TaxID=253628 RepID=A0A0D2ANN1_9PEZI|nr:OPT family small oligopeptide transporter [Verruconis gallopava]KIW08125.1 OPT family small oligopeptide transporter [Verruconis gallopava]
MSRTPLLLRSSPALGTGSYGALPTERLSSSSEDESDLTPHQKFLRHSVEGKIQKGKHALRKAYTADDGDEYTAASRIDRNGSNTTAKARTAQNGDATSDTMRSEGGLSHRKAARKRRSSTGSELGERASTHAEDLGDYRDKDNELINHEGIEARFTGSALPTFAPLGKSTSRSSTRKSMSDERVLDEDLVRNDDEEDDNDDDDGQRANGNIPIPPADDSPYAQVRASVPPTDNTMLSINTPRMWILSIAFAIFGSSTNLFFSLRFPSVSITPVIALLIVHPIGLLWDASLKRDDDPDEVFVNGTLQHFETSEPDGWMSGLKVERWTRRARLWLAQGRWNEKEHCCVFIASNVSFGFAFATDVIVEQTKFYNQDLSITYQILLTLSTQILGYSLAGLTRRFLVRPSGMIWPGTLVSTAMFSSLHKEENKPADGWHISRFRFFAYVFLGSVVFYFLPGLLFPALSWFNVITWFAPRNVVVANLFGVTSGLGLFPMTFDWSQIAYIGSPLVVPFWAALNIIGGLVIVMWIIAPILYYTNVMYSSYMPILSTAVFDNEGKPYNVQRILTDKFVFDIDAYQNYSRVFLPITYVLSYALQFASLSALLTHTACWHGRDIVQQWKRSWREIRSEKFVYQPISSESSNGDLEPIQTRTSFASIRSEHSEPGLDHLMSGEDVHNRLMRRYEDVPMSWYLLSGISMLAIGMFLVEYFPVYLPWYGLLMAIGICAVLFIPIGIVMAITNQQNSIYLICQLICGVVFPGRPVANMVFVTYGYISSTQGLKFSSDLKLGHYMKIPPRVLFNLQLTATIVSSLTQIGVLNWMLANIPGICTPQAINGFTCPIARVHFNGSILWGVVGPARFFGPGALYRPLVWAFLVGAIAPIVVWLVARRGTKKTRALLQKVNLPVLFGSLSWIPPATGLNFSVWALVCWLFNYRLRRQKSEWWTKYTMTLSAALDSGLAVGVVVVFFGIVWPGWMDGFSWWGTEIYKQGCDWQACAYKTLAPNEKFGPSRW